MQINSDFEEILLAFNAEGVKYLVVGAYAVAAHARPRATGDIDLWVDVSAENAGKVFRALCVFGAPMDHIDERTFNEPNIVLQIGIAPLRIDILTGIDGLSFDEAWPNRIDSFIGDDARCGDRTGRLDTKEVERSGERRSRSRTPRT